MLRRTAARKVGAAACWLRCRAFLQLPKYNPSGIFDGVRVSGPAGTWDPKPEAPLEYRGPLSAIQSNVPGVQFGELMPRLAGMMDKLAVLRSVNHGSGDHTKGNHWMLTGFERPAFKTGLSRRFQCLLCQLFVSLPCGKSASN